MDNSRDALKAGSSKDLVRFFASSVDLKIDGESTSYSKTQAEFILKDFFRKYPPNSFEFVHQGASREGLTYAIGKYNHSDGSFRVYLLLKDINGSYLIDTMDFSDDN